MLLKECLILISVMANLNQISKSETSIVHVPSMFPSQQLLLYDGEKHNLSQVFEHQVDNECLTFQDVRGIASDIYKIRAGEKRSFSHDWARDFFKRHSNEFEKQKHSYSLLNLSVNFMTKNIIVNPDLGNS